MPRKRLVASDHGQPASDPGRPASMPGQTASTPRNPGAPDAPRPKPRRSSPSAKSEIRNQRLEILPLETIPLARINPAPYNPRVDLKPSDPEYQKLEAEMKAFGFAHGLVWNRRTGNLVGGHQRLKILRAHGHTEIQVAVCDLDTPQEKAFNIALNKAGGRWDNDALASLLADLEKELSPEQLALTALDADEIDKLVHQGYQLVEQLIAPETEEPHTEIEEGDVPEPPADPITKPGDLWLLGDHRLLCGSSTKAEDVERLMDGKQSDLMLTDPPYNVDYTGKTKSALKVANDSMADGDFRKFLVACFAAAFEVMKPGASFYIWHADLEGFNFRGAVQDCGEKVRQCLVWTKDVLVMGRQDYHYQHEPCLYGWKDGASHGWYSDRKQTTLLRFDRPKRSTDHPTMKPVALFAYLMGNSTAPQGLVYDPFLGSGTTLIAAEQLGRKCYGMEISPRYCDVTVKRWETLTGNKAQLQDEHD